MLAMTGFHAGAFGFNPSKCPAFCIIVTVTESPAFSPRWRRPVASIHCSLALSAISNSCFVPIGKRPVADASRYRPGVRGRSAQELLDDGPPQTWRSIPMTDSKSSGPSISTTPATRNGDGVWSGLSAGSLCRAASQSAKCPPDE